MTDTQTIKTDDFHENRKYKDTLFRLIFNEKEALLELYNALNHSDYTNIDDLTYYTLQDAVYINFKNDVSFLLSDTLSLYEHQSTLNPNMPIRGLIYLARNYSSYIDQHQLDIYSSTLQMLPFPQYIVFYNGVDDAPEQEILSLHDAFGEYPDKQPCLDCKATILNINYGKNLELMKQCKSLSDYATFIHLIRSYIKVGLTLAQAAEQTINECIKNNVLKAFLLKHRGEVTNVVLSTFYKEVHERGEREFHEKRGFEKGITHGQRTTLISLVQKKVEKNLNAFAIAEILEEPVDTISSIISAIKEHPNADTNELYQFIYEQKK